MKLNYPDALIDIAVNKGCEDMVTLNPNINEVIIYDRNKVKKTFTFKKNSWRNKICFIFSKK